jgi:uncharacterized OB-fold protein
MTMIIPAAGRGTVVAASAVTTNAPGGPALVGVRCPDCGLVAFPAPVRCPGCLATSLAPHVLARVGTLYSYATVHVGPPGWPVPYTVGYVDLPDGARVFGHMADEWALHPDRPVRIELVEAGPDTYVATWHPVDANRTNYA